MADPSTAAHRFVNEAPAGARPDGTAVDPRGNGHVYEQIARVLRGEIEPLVAVPAGVDDRPLRIALVVPRFGFGSGGHAVLFRLMHALEERGHAVTYWVHDPFDEHGSASNAELRQLIIDQYAPIEGPVFAGFEHWNGADIALATGWQTAYPVMSLPRCRARAYIVNDYEPDFYPQSIEAFYADQTYGLGLPLVLGGGDWLRQTIETRHEVTVAATFPYPVDPAFQVRNAERRDDTIVLYGRNTTPRRAVGLALLALEEVHRRRPGIKVVLFGDGEQPATTFPYEHFGPIEAEALSWVYSTATIGIGLSMTHGSLVPHDMMACGLPVVDLAGYGTGVEHAGTGIVELTPFDPFAMADAIERLLDDPALRAQRAEMGLAYVSEHRWSDSAARVEAGFRAMLRARSGESGPAVADGSLAGD